AAVKPAKAEPAAEAAQPRVAAAEKSPEPAGAPAVHKDAPMPEIDARDNDDPRVRAWVARFIKPDEPRFGEIIRGLDSGAAPEFIEFRAAAEEIPLPTAAAAKAARASAISKAAAAFKVLRARALREKANAGSPSTAEQRYRQAIFVLSILLVIMTTAVVILMLR